MQASFIKSAAGASDFPLDSGREVAVVGRSNSGKSSAINRIVGHGKLARVSKTPGRTQLINFFDLGADSRLVDLPGYGFARVPEPVRRQWQGLVDAYFDQRTAVAGLLLTVDIRRGLRDGDWRMLEWATALALPVLILLTKADKLSRGAAAKTRLEVLAELEGSGGDVDAVAFSSVTGTGVEIARAKLGEWLQRESAQ